MWGTLFKVFSDAVGPLLKPILEQLVRKAIEGFLKNLGGTSTSPGGLVLQMTDPSVDAAIDKTVQDLLES